MFKACPKCGTPWPTREAFLGDPEVVLVGYQVNFKTLAAGLLLFNHACATTMALLAEEFKELYDGPVFVERATGTSECPGHCLHKDNLGPCPVQCECGYVRHILQAIKAWPKTPAAGQKKIGK